MSRTPLQSDPSSSEMRSPEELPSPGSNHTPHTWLNKMNFENIKEYLLINILIYFNFYFIIFMTNLCENFLHKIALFLLSSAAILTVFEYFYKSLQILYQGIIYFSDQFWTTFVPSKVKIN